MTRLQNAYHVAGDMKRARAFYEDVLGLKPKFADGDRWVQYDAGGANFALSGAEEAADGAAGAVLVFEVADLDASAAAVGAAGGMVMATRDMGDHGRTLTFRDTEGNIGQLFMRARRPA